MSLQQVTIQVLQRNGRKFFTSIIGLPDDLDKEKIVHHLKKIKDTKNIKKIKKFLFRNSPKKKIIII